MNAPKQIGVYEDRIRKDEAATMNSIKKKEPSSNTEGKSSRESM